MVRAMISSSNAAITWNSDREIVSGETPCWIYDPRKDLSSNAAITWNSARELVSGDNFYWIHDPRDDFILQCSNHLPLVIGPSFIPPTHRATQGFSVAGPPKIGYRRNPPMPPGPDPRDDFILPRGWMLETMQAILQTSSNVRLLCKFAKNLG